MVVNSLSKSLCQRGKGDPLSGAAVVNNHAAALRRDAGDGGDDNLMRDHQDKAAILDLFHPIAKRGQSLVAVDMAIKKGIQPVMRGERTDVHLVRGVLAPAPAAAENDVRDDPVHPHVGANGTPLCAADIIQISLCGTVIDLKMRRIAEAGGQSMPQKQDVTVDFRNCLAKRFGACRRCEKQQGGHDG